MNRARAPRSVVVVMAGGRGTRLGRVEKPMLPVGGIPLVERVVRAAEATELARVYIAVSPRTPRTQAYCRESDWQVIETRGDGYPEDVGELALSFPRFVTTSADLPFVNPRSLVEFIMNVRTKRSGRVGLLPEALCRTRTPAALAWSGTPRVAAPARIVGVNWVVRGSTEIDRPFLFHDPDLQFNVNTPTDLRLARSHWRELFRRVDRSALRSAPASVRTREPAVVVRGAVA
jgi:adenosylcobinamide-phosphate guanylyltransferase